jgi:hypothetical protein
MFKEKKMNISDIMSNYFNESKLNENNMNKQQKATSQSIPIIVSKSKWSVDEKIMSRIYEFDDKEKSVYFMQQVMQYISNSEHNIEARFKKEKCTIIIRAISPYITFYEQDVAKYFDKIYKDTDYLKLEYDHDQDFYE